MIEEAYERMRRFEKNCEGEDRVEVKWLLTLLQITSPEPFCLPLKTFVLHHSI